MSEEDDILVFTATSTEENKKEPKTEQPKEDLEKIMKRKEKFGMTEGTSEQLEKRRQRFGVTNEEIQKNLMITENSKRDNKKGRKKFEKGGKFKRSKKDKPTTPTKPTKPLVQIDDETKKRREEKFKSSQ